MTESPDPWALPGLVRWLDTLVLRLFRGLAILPTDSSRPPGVLEALQKRLPHNPVELRATVGQSPAAAVADAFGTAPTLDALLNPVLDQEFVVIFLAGLGPEDLAKWSVFFQRFAAARASGRAGPALLVLEGPLGLDAPAGALSEAWRTGLRRGDLVIWAEEHVPATREGLAADLAVALAVELCGWRLDLAAALVQASLYDLADPLGWLAQRSETPICAADPPCPLAILAERQNGALRRRIWNAQLTALFPALESLRLEIVATHRSRLRLDDHLRSLGVASVEEIELGALRFQLRRFMTRPEAERLEMLARARNALAHRKPVDAEDALHLFRA